jgi:hypothetical protein
VRLVEPVDDAAAAVGVQAKYYTLEVVKLRGGPSSLDRCP